MKIPFSSTLPLALVSAALAFTLTGCTTVKLDANGESAAVYQLNEFRMLVNATAPATVAATQQAFRELDLFETKNKTETFAAELNARSRTDEKIHVEIAEVNSRQTLVKIRWGMTGDKRKSQNLYNLVERNLRSGS